MPYVNAETGIPHDPFAGYGWMVDPRRWLNKRELFAAMAMQGYCANPEILHWSHEEMAEHAVEAADQLCVAIEETKSL